jgi:hypothetical protein
MKKSKKIECKNCGSQEFITALNAYDIYEVIDKKLIKVKTECTDDEFELFCRDCSEKLNTSELEIEG